MNISFHGNGTLTYIIKLKYIHIGLWQVPNPRTGVFITKSMKGTGTEGE